MWACSLLIWRRLWRPALCNEAGPIVSATIHCIAFNEDGIEVRMSAEAWLDHSDGLAAAGVCTGNRTDTGYQLLCASLGRCIPLPPVQPCPRAPIAAFSPKRSPGSRRSLQGVATRVIVDISERKGEGAGGRGAGAWQKKRRARARMQVTRETRDGAHKFEHLPRRVLLPPILCVSGNAAQWTVAVLPGHQQGRSLSHRPRPCSRWPTCRAGRGKACRPRSPWPRRPHASPPPAAPRAAAQTWDTATLSIFSSWREMWHRCFES